MTKLGHMQEEVAKGNDGPPADIRGDVVSLQPRYLPITELDLSRRNQISWDLGSPDFLWNLSTKLTNCVCGPQLLQTTDHPRNRILNDN